MSEIPFAAGRSWIYSSLIIDKFIAREFKSIKHPFCQTLEVQVLQRSMCVSRRVTQVHFTQGKCRGNVERKSGYLARGVLGGSLRASRVWVDLRSGGWGWCWAAERTFAHCRSTWKKSVRLSSRPLSSLIHLKADTRRERSPCLFRADNSTPSPAHADEPVCRNAGRVVPKPAALRSRLEGAGRSRLPSDDQGKVLSSLILCNPQP